MNDRLRVLFVDDEPFVLQGLQRMLRNMRSEWDMVFVTSGAEGLEVLARSHVDVVVADMRMPGMNGAQFLNHVKELHPGTVRLVLSGYADRDLILQAEGATHQFLSKPCDPGTLRSVILSAMHLAPAIHSPEVRRVVGSIAHLPSVPTIYEEILLTLESEASTIEALAALVRRDPGMSANLLKLVNSAYFGLRQRISEPGEAIAFLGVDTLKSLALLHGIFGQVAGFPAGVDPGWLWTHAVDTAAAAREIARMEGLGHEGQSEAFTGGLLHDIGLLILVSSFKEEYLRITDLLRRDALSLPEAERSVLGAHHGEVGAHLLSLWGVPERVVDAVARHHDPRFGEAGTVDPALIVFAAEAFMAPEGDYRAFRIAREPEPGPVAAALGPARFVSWKAFIERPGGAEEMP